MKFDNMTGSTFSFDKDFPLSHFTYDLTLRRPLTKHEIDSDKNRWEYYFEGERVKKSSLVTSKRYSIVSKMAFDIYACNHELDTNEICKVLLMLKNVDELIEHVGRNKLRIK